MKLQFYCQKTEDHEHPFTSGSEVLLSASMSSESVAPSPNAESSASMTKFTPELHTGEGFSDMVDTLIANPNVKSVHFLNTAYLQRYNKKLLLIAEGVSSEESDKRSQDLAREIKVEWIKQNEEAIKRLKEHYGNDCVLDWELLVRDSGDNYEFKVQHGKVRNLYFSPLKKAHGGRKFKHAVDQLVNYIYKNKLPVIIKQKVKSEKLTETDVKECLRDFVLEECAVRSLLTYQYEVYRGSLGCAIHTAYEELSTDKNKIIHVDIGAQAELEERKKGSQLRVEAYNNSQYGKFETKIKFSQSEEQVEFDESQLPIRQIDRSKSSLLTFRNKTIDALNPRNELLRQDSDPSAEEQSQIIRITLPGGIYVETCNEQAANRIILSCYSRFFQVRKGGRNDQEIGDRAMSNSSSLYDLHPSFQ